MDERILRSSLNHIRFCISDPNTYMKVIFQNIFWQSHKRVLSCMILDMIVLTACLQTFSKLRKCNQRFFLNYYKFHFFYMYWKYISTFLQKTKRRYVPKSFHHYLICHGEQICNKDILCTPKFCFCLPMRPMDAVLLTHVSSLFFFLLVTC